MLAAAIFVIFPICLVMAAWTDLLEMKIPNRIPIVLGAAFLVLAPFAGLSLAEFGFHIAAGLVVFVVCFGLFAINVMGGGDAKLLTAAALWFGLNMSLATFLIYVSYIGGILTILILIVRASANRVLAMGLPVPNSILMAKKIPYGIAIGIAGILAFPDSPLVVAVLEGLR
jgi:prepilin peptidase CpaA